MVLPAHLQKSIGNTDASGCRSLCSTTASSQNVNPGLSAPNGPVPSADVWQEAAGTSLKAKSNKNCKCSCQATCRPAFQQASPLAHIAVVQSKHHHHHHPCFSSHNTCITLHCHHQRDAACRAATPPVGLFTRAVQCTAPARATTHWQAKHASITPLNTPWYQGIQQQPNASANCKCVKAQGHPCCAHIGSAKASLLPELRQSLQHHQPCSG